MHDNNKKKCIRFILKLMGVRLFKKASSSFNEWKNVTLTSLYLKKLYRSYT